MTQILTEAPASARELDSYTDDYLFDLQGFRVLKGALQPDLLQGLNQWIDEQPPREPGEWAGHVQVHSYGGVDGINYQNIVEGGPLFEQLIDHPAWIGAVRRYICNQFNRLSIYECFLNVRKQGGFIGIHSGGHIAAMPNTVRHHTGQWFVGQINILMALTDIGPGDGATVVIPGSHKSHMIHPDLLGGDQQVYRGHEAASGAVGSQEVHLKAGDALMFTDAICHGSSQRTNPGERRVIIYRYSPHTAATRFNYLPSEEFLARLTPERRAIVAPVPVRRRP